MPAMLRLIEMREEARVRGDTNTAALARREGDLAPADEASERAASRLGIVA